jgi:Glycosyltransferase
LSNTLHILFLASWYPNPEEPQDGNFIERHAQAVGLKAKVAALYVHSLASAKDFKIEIKENKQITECRVFYPKTKRYQIFQKLANYQKAHRIGYEVLEEKFGHFDVCHLNVFYPAGIFALYLKKKFQLPIIITEHWTKFLSINPTSFNLHEKYIISRVGQEASMICPVSHDLKNAIQEFVSHDRYQVIPNVVDTRLFKIKPPRSKDTPIRILHISTLNDSHKNTSGMLRVLAKLFKERTDCTATFIGNHYGDHFIEMANELGIAQERLTILPEIPLTSIATKLVEHDLFLLFSNYENLPCVISEALVSGLPIIASDVGGVREMVNPKNGRLVPAGDEKALKIALHDVLDHIDIFDPIAISEAAKRRYGFESVGKAYFNLYQNIV